MRRVLIAGMAYDYGIRERGPSNEHYNLVLPLRQVAEVAFFDYIERQRETGRDGMNRDLLALVERERPDVTIFVMFRDEFDPQTVHQISASTRTIAFLYDDSWRTAYSRDCARDFDFVTTAEPAGIGRFAQAGIHNVLLAPFGFNPDVYRRDELPLRHELSFFGLPHPYRQWAIGRLREAGFEVFVRGPGWPGGKVSIEEMVRTINESAINLNVSNSRHWEPAYLLSSPKALAWNLLRDKVGEQIKGRHFEIAGCGGFQLSHEVPSLDQFFRPGEEIVTYSSVTDLIAKVRYYLEHDAERRAIAEAGRHRAIKDHTAQGYLSRLVDEAIRRRPTIDPRVV